MPTKENANQQNEVNSNRRKPIRKAPGTRMGTLEDWRSASNNSGKAFGRHGQSVRDGR